MLSTLYQVENWVRDVLPVILLVAALSPLGGCELGETGPDGTGNTDGNTPGNGAGSGAKCAVSSQATPSGVPVNALSQADDSIAAYGDDLNTFWSVNACVFKADTALYPTVQQNAISYSYPQTIVYDPALFERFWQDWGSELPTKLIVAHEWGHQYQYAHNFQYSTTFEYEQDADQRADYYLGTLAQKQGTAKLADVADLLKRFACSTGDPDSVPWFTEGAHGSCMQRANAVSGGFDQAVSTSTVGRGALSNPSAPAPTAGVWTGTIELAVTVIDEDGIATSKGVTDSYSFTIDANGKVSDENGTGALPDVGAEKVTAIETTKLNFDIVSTTKAVSFDDTATRYDADLRVDGGTIGDVVVTGTGAESDVLALLSDGRLNVYLHESLTLTTEAGITVTIVIETTGTMTHQP
jgi:hypothetical protein